MTLQGTLHVMPKLANPNKVLSLITGQAVPGNAGVALMARIRSQSGALITQASLSTISYQIFDIQAWVDGSGDATEVTAATSMTISSVIFDSLQQPSPQTSLWTKDGPGNLGPDGEWGYNFLFVVPAASFTVARSGNRHRAQCLFTPTTGQQFRLLYEFDTIKVFPAA